MVSNESAWESDQDGRTEDGRDRPTEAGETVHRCCTVKGSPGPLELLILTFLVTAAAFDDTVNHHSKETIRKKNKNLPAAAHSAVIRCNVSHSKPPSVPYQLCMCNE